MGCIGTVSALTIYLSRNFKYILYLLIGFSNLLFGLLLEYLRANLGFYIL
jgi:hypothetical protein